MDESAREWLMARAVIVGVLRELRPDLPREDHEHNAAAILARLASHQPPLIVTVVKDD